MALVNEQVILPWKRVQDRITVTIDFTAFLPVGATITSVSSSVEVFQGIDPDPEAILVGLPTFAGAYVSQKIEQGLPGVTYLIALTAELSTGLSLTIQAKQSVLEEGFPPGPVYSTHYFTTPPYPINVEDFVGISGDLTGVISKYYPTPQDHVTISTTIIGAELYGGGKDGYAQDHVEITSSLVGAELYGGGKAFSTEESLYITGDLLGAVLYGDQVAYSFEDYVTISSDLVSGTLT